MLYPTELRALGATAYCPSAILSSGNVASVAISSPSQRPPSSWFQPQVRYDQAVVPSLVKPTSTARLTNAVAQAIC